MPSAEGLAFALANKDSQAKNKLLLKLFEFTYPTAGIRMAQEACVRHEQTQRNLHLAFALAAFQREHGKYADKLDALAPKYLTKIPNDLFTDKPLVYRPTEKGYLLYSFGMNGKDDDGRSHFDEPSGDDIGVRMPIPKPKSK
jgi:hypothetical protein